MIPALILGICLLVGLVLLAQWFVNADPKTLARGVRYGAAGLGVLFVLWLAVSGRLGVALGLAAFLLPVILRWRAVWNRVKTAGGPTPGRTSDLTTDWLEVSLDHDTGRMAGRVRKGSFEGASLDDLPLDRLIELMAEVRAEDPRSASVLEAYLDRVHGPDWRDLDEPAAAPGGGPSGHRDAGGTSGGDAAGAGAGAGRTGGRMTRKEALSILGLEEGAGEAQIKEAHRRLMMKFHPDHGGSDYLAAKLNEAKEVLLGR